MDRFLGFQTRRGYTRRQFICKSALLSAAGLAGSAAGRPRNAVAQSKLPQRSPSEAGRLSVAAIMTEYRPWSHADVIVGRFIQGYELDVSPHWPDMKVRAMYVDQFPTTDLSRPIGRYYGVPIAPSIREAILDDEGKVAVDGVLLIGEHGNYPYNERGQHLYPRRRLFEETVAAFEDAGECVPVFNDKHLAARWRDAKAMYDLAKKLGIPFMAGSSLPVAWRRPWLELPVGAPIEAAVSVGYGGLEAYGFHALETLQCMVERRRGGEAGVRRVQCIEGDDVWGAIDSGRIPRALVEAALGRHDPPQSLRDRDRCKQPAAFLIDYVDGFQAACVMLNGLARQFLFAAQIAGDTRPVSTQFWLQEPNFGHFSYLSNAIMEMFRTGKPSYPVERTVLTTGMVARGMDSRYESHRAIDTPDLAIAYTPVDHDLGAYRHPEASNSRDGGWIELFNGENLDGWRENRYRADPRWEVRDGILRGSGGQGYLATYEQFADFELFAEARISDTGGRRGNSGIYFRCQPHDDREQEYPAGYEAQCDHGDRNNPTGSLYNLGLPGARAPAAPAKDGEWFTLRIRARDGHLETWVNGAPAADCADPEVRYRRGYILLQLHHESGIVEFREVRLRRL